MCGILAVIGKADKEKVIKLSARMSHRGPDERDIYQAPNGSILSHERLSIIDLTTGKQPIQGTDTAYVIHNGEIYNHQKLRDGELKDHSFRTTCDSEVIVHLYEKYGYDFCDKLDGIFAFVVLDNDRFIVGRDPLGVKPLYYGYDAEGKMYFASEMKAIADQCIRMESFPAGSYYTPETGFVKWYNPEWADYRTCKNEFNPELLRESLVEATRKRLMSDVPLAVLLSGGLDSSLISSITMRIAEERGQQLHSFSVGVNLDAPDMIAAREVAKFIGTVHHEITFSVEEGIKALEKIIWHLETYDITTIRAATPMYFLSKAVVEKGFKVVLSGEGSDEVFGGYLYFHNAPSSEEFQKETISRLQRLSTADLLRADKSTMAWGLEARVPFLDKQFMQVAVSMKPQEKQPNRLIGKIEKYPIRKAFDTKERPYLPDSILWRQKEQFSDGVGYSWIDSLKEYANNAVSDKEFSQAAKLFPYNTPETKEAFLFRTIFAKHFPQDHCIKTVMTWVPKWQQSTDPSGRACDTHVDKLEKDVTNLQTVFSE